MNSSCWHLAQNPSVQGHSPSTPGCQEHSPRAHLLPCGCSCDCSRHLQNGGNVNASAEKALCKGALGAGVSLVISATPLTFFTLPATAHQLKKARNLERPSLILESLVAFITIINIFFILGAAYEFSHTLTNSTYLGLAGGFLGTFIWTSLLSRRMRRARALATNETTGLLRAPWDAPWTTQGVVGKGRGHKAAERAAQAPPPPAWVQGVPAKNAGSPMPEVQDVINRGRTPGMS